MPPPARGKEKILVIGSGIGGLSTGIILAKLGFDVTVIEKNPQPGGMVRSYVRRGVQCDVGLHYLGALDHGHCCAAVSISWKLRTGWRSFAWGSADRWIAIFSSTTIWASLVSMCPLVLRPTKPG